MKDKYINIQLTNVNASYYKYIWLLLILSNFVIIFHLFATYIITKTDILEYIINKLFNQFNIDWISLDLLDLNKSEISTLELNLTKLKILAKNLS